GAFDLVEHGQALGERGAARTAADGVHEMAVVVDSDRIFFDGLVVGEVFNRDAGSVLREVRGDGARGFPFIEGPRSVVGDGAQGPGEIWLPDQGRLVLLDRYRRVAGGVEVDAGGLRVFLEVGEVPGDGEGCVPGHREAVFREGDGRFE